MKSILYILAFVFIGCNTAPSKKKQTEQLNTQAENHPGKALMKSKCYACHNATSPQDQRIGPPMIAIKKHYITESTTKELFLKEFVSFVKNPSEENAKMKGAVRKFGLMPKQYFEEADLKAIAEYMYDYEIEQPEWFQKHWKERGTHQGNGKHASQKKKTEVGMQYAMKTKQQLAKNLMGALQRGGTTEALQFCNVKAIPITDSMSVVQNVKIKRISNKPRNPKNVATKEEAKYIAMFQQKLDAKEAYSPIVKSLNTGKKQFYAPIVTNQMCLQCHGIPNKNVKSNTMETLKKLYPLDLALDYDVNQVRGLWSIQYKE